VPRLVTHHGVDPSQHPGARRRSVRFGAIVAGAFACLLVSTSASAIVPMAVRPARRSAPAKSTARYVPAKSHADPASEEAPLAAIIVSGRSTGTTASMQVRGVRAWIADGPRPTTLRHLATRGSTPRAVSMLPSHWGATHLSV
jgi:hypothetical protein